MEERNVRNDMYYRLIKNAIKTQEIDEKIGRVGVLFCSIEQTLDFSFILRGAFITLRSYVSCITKNIFIRSKNKCCKKQKNRLLKSLRF